MLPCREVRSRPRIRTERPKKTTWLNVYVGGTLVAGTEHRERPAKWKGTPMSSRIMLDQLRIASPCQASWADMVGDDGVRFCGLCQKHVYNIAAVTADQAEALIRETEGGACLRLYRRRDGTVLTSDCPQGAARAAWSRWRRLAAAVLIALAGIIAGAASLRASTTGGLRQVTPPPSGATLQDWYDWALEVLGLRPRPVVMGRWCSQPPSPPPPASPPT